MTRNNFDSPWKEVIDCFLQPFVEFCLPEAAADIDWEKGYEPLDKELVAIARDHEMGNRIADKLYKVWRNTGKELWLLLHIEVQAQKEPTFPERMYVYNYRLFDRYRQSIVSIAILADDDPRWHPTSYERSAWYTQILFKFPSVKLLSYASKQDALEQSTNPFAIVILTHLKAQQTRQQPTERLQSKLAITRALYERGFNKRYILQLFRFIDWMMALPAPLDLQYTLELEKLEEEKHVQYITSVERIGMQRGMEQGMQQGERALLERLLMRRFGELPARYHERLNQASSEQLLALSDRLLEATTLSEIFKE